jgi:uncharacterized protein
VEEVNEERSYYVYALKDTRSTPAKPFYVGKGTGIRAWEHDLKTDTSAKGKRISAIHEAGLEVLVSKLVEDVTELEALRIEAELITAFGTETTGGLLTNSVVPGLNPSKRRLRNLVMPFGVAEKAQIGLSMLKDAVLELSIANADGVTNSDVAHSLGLQSDYLGGSKDYLSWSILGLLMREGRLKRVDKKRHKAQVR